MVGAVLLRGVVVPGERCPDVTSGQAIGAATASAGWMTRVQRDDGSYLYEFDVNSGQPSTDYNAVRHAGVTLALYELAESGQFDAYAPADEGLRWEMAHLHRVQGAAGLDDPYNGEISLGGTALALAGLAHRRLATDEATYDTLMHQLAGFILLMQRGDGSFLSEWDRATDMPYPNETST